jgi:hypothetical protein
MNHPAVSMPQSSIGRIGRHIKKSLGIHISLACVFTIVAGCSSFRISSAQPTLTLVRDGKSTYSIVYAANAPSSVKTAAIDLQRYIEKSTKAKLSLSTQNQIPQSPFISVGDTAAARASGLNTNDIPLEGYRMVTRNGNIYILGQDTADGELTPQKGTSHGTSNGVSTFLEDYLNLRWLMPGEMGEDVPSLAAVAIPAIDRTEAPAFPSRQLVYIQNDNEAVKAWMQRQKLGASLSVRTSHSWDRIVPPSMYAEHPDWFAEIGGKRVPPVGDRYKVETTNPEVIQHFAQSILKGFEERPDRFALSLSATDSANWSESAASKALYDKDPKGRLSTTPLMLKFYNDVAKIVGKARPDRMVSGYIYADHLYPPSTGIPYIEPNFFPVVATSISYGYQLYRPAVQKDWDYIMSTWSSKAPYVGYYDLPTAISGGVIAPPAPEILNFIFPRLAKYKIKHIDYTSDGSWGEAGVKNYVVSKLMWNPNQDASALAHEFYQRAYGPAAGAKVEQIYQSLEAAIKAYYNKDQGIAYTASPAYIKEVLAVQYPQMERLYLEATQAATNATPEQLARLNLFGQYIMLVQWQLRNYGLLPAKSNSPLYRTDLQLEQMFKGEAAGFGFANNPGITLAKSEKKFAPVKVELLPKLANARPNSGGTATFSTLQANRILFFPTQDNEIQIKPVRVGTQTAIVQYGVYDAFGKRITGGVMTPGEIIRFTTAEKQVYYLDVEGTTASFEVEIRGAPFAIYADQDPKRRGLRFVNKTTPVYFYVPAGLKDFELTVSTASPRETSLSELYSPSGKLISTLDTQTTTGARVNLKQESMPNDWEGFWCIDVRKAPLGSLGTVNVKFGSSLPQWISTNPEQPLRVSNLSGD